MTAARGLETSFWGDELTYMESLNGGEGRGNVRTLDVS